VNGELLAQFPDQPSYRATLTLAGSQYILRCVWRARTSSWYATVLDAGGTVLAAGRRLSPGWFPWRGILTELGGHLYVEGADPYERDGLRLWFFADELLEQDPPETIRGVVVTGE